MVSPLAMQENDAASRQRWAGGRVLESHDGRKMISFQLGRSTTERRPSEEGRERISGWRRRRLAASDGMRLYSGLGTHYIFAHVGNPPQELSLVVDTGSFNTAFPCADCEGCRGGRQDLWDPSMSRTSTVLSCDSCEGSSYK